MIGETVTRIRSGASTTVDDYNDPIPGADMEENIPGAMFDPGGTAEPVEPGRTPVITEPTLYFLRAWPDLTAGDRVRVRGDEYEIQGDPADWRNDGFGGLVARLKKVAG